MPNNAFKSVFVHIRILFFRYESNSTIMWSVFFTKAIVFAHGMKFLKVISVNKAFSFIDPSIAKYLKIGATDGVTYDILRVKGCPCCRDLYYEVYRKFFWKLGIERQ